MSTHNSRHNAGGNRKPQGYLGTRNNQQGRVENHLRIPEEVAEAVRQAGREEPRIRLQAFGASAYHCVGRLLVIRRAPVADTEALQNKILDALSPLRRKAVAEMVSAMVLEGTIVIDSAVLPEGPGDRQQRVLTLYKNNLREGDRYEVVTIHRHHLSGNHLGTWFRSIQADRFHNRSEGEVIRSSLPLISGHLGDVYRSQQMLARVSRFCNMPVAPAHFDRYVRYMALPLGEWHDSETKLNDEREAARRILMAPDTTAVEALLAHSQNLGGYEVRDRKPVVFDRDREAVTKSAPRAYVVSTTSELEEAAEQAAATSQFEAELAKAREDRRRRDEAKAPAHAVAQPAPVAAAQSAPVAAAQPAPVAAARPTARPSWMNLPRRK